MSGDLSLTDRSTWVAILSVAAAVATDVFHSDLSGYVSGAATIAAGTVVAFTLLAKHHYQAALVQEAGAVASTLPLSQVIVSGEQAVVHLPPQPPHTPAAATAPATVLEGLQSPPAAPQAPPGA